MLSSSLLRGAGAALVPARHRICAATVSAGLSSAFRHEAPARAAYSSHPPAAPPGSGSSSSSSSSPSHGERSGPFTMRTLEEHYRSGTPVAMVTAYDYSSAMFAHAAGIDMVLVGDSLGMVVLGHADTVPVTMADMIHHTRAVSRALSTARNRPMIIGDMPFGAYYSPDVAVRSAVALMQEGRCDAVKMEGGKRRPDVIAQVAATVSAGIPVMGHIGLTPQSVAALGGFTLQGKTASAAMHLLEDAQALQSAGCFAVVLEMVPGKVAEIVTQNISIPTIGIGAGNGTSGQVLVYHDMLGTFDKFVPSFCKQYAQIGPQVKQALASYREEVRSRQFPAKEHTPTIKSAELEEFRNLVAASQPQKRSFSSLVRPQSLAPRSPLSSSRAFSSFSTTTTTTTSSSPIALQKCARPMRKVVVVGGGAMGSLVASKLAMLGENNVWMITSWLEQVNTINRSGLNVRSVGSAAAASSDSVPTAVSRPAGPTVSADGCVVNFNAVTPDSLEALTQTGPADLGLVLVKSTSTANAAKVLSKVLKPGGAVVTLQNGMGNIEVLRQALPHAHVLGGVTLNGATMLEPGLCLHTGSAETYLAAPSSHSALHVLGIDVAAMLSAAGLRTVLVESEDAMNTILWGKLLVNAAINPITALLDVNNGSLLKDDSCGNVIRDVVSEVANLAAEAKVQLPYEDPVRQVYKVLEATAPNVSSMLADVRRGVPTEIDNINGFVVMEGKRRHVPTPMNSALVCLVKSMNNRGRGSSADFASCGSIFSSVGSAAGSHRAKTSWAKSSWTVRTYSTQPTILRSIQEVREWRRSLPQAATVGFVPTMGALHEGHLSLARLAREQCDFATASVFVNPSQFENKEDLQKYPRTLESDVELLSRQDVKMVFSPEVEEMYPSTQERTVTMTVAGANDLAEGSKRPGFFNAVATVVTRLFNIVQPTKAFFGQKDAQQCATIRQMVRDLNSPVEIVIGPTLREPDGLAMSSRNVRITREDRPHAKIIFQALSAGEHAIHSGERSPEAVKRIVMDVLRSEPRFKLEYVSIANAISMREITEPLPETLKPQSICISTAGILGPVRLIDNVLL